MKPVILFVVLLFGLQVSAQDKKQDRLKHKHEKWDSAFVIKFNGDTIYGEIDARDDFSVLTKQDASAANDIYLSEHIVFFADHEDKKEERFFLRELKEIYLYTAKDGFQKFINKEKEQQETGYGEMYRVVADGKCQLLYEGTISRDIMLPNDFRYYIYYKGEKTLIKRVTNPVDGIVIAPDFKKKCAKIFAECTELVEKIENGTLTYNETKEIVKQFNACMVKK